MNFLRHTSDRSSCAAEAEADAEFAAQAAMRAADVGKLEGLQGMAEAFAGWLHRKGALEMESGGEDSVEKLRQLSGSFNKAARAVRQIVVLKHEVAGLRPQPGTRARAPANENAATGGRGGRGSQRFNGRDRSDIDDYDDEEVREEEAEADAWFTKLMTALDVDIEAAGPEVVEAASKVSPVEKMSTIAFSIRHPTLDACLLEIEHDKLWDLFAPRHGRPRESPPPPRPPPLPPE